MAFHLVLLIAGFVLLVKGAGWLVDSASAFARAVRVSDLVIGLTIVAFGTSMPELSVSFIAGLKGSPALSIANVVGSNICNILLILGVSALIFPLSAASATVWKEIPFMLLAAVVLIVQSNDQLIDQASRSALTRADGVVMLLFFVLFLVYIAQVIGAGRASTPAPAAAPARVGKGLVWMGVGFVMLIVGGNLIVDSAVEIARRMGISESLIGLTIVAFGTSLPELATSATAAYKGNADIAVGNIVGSNIFNTLLILGMSSLALPLPCTPAGNIDLAVMLAATILLFLAMFLGKPRHQIQRSEGAVFLGTYVAYLAFLLWRG